jgi:hypothetical protein
MNQVEDLPAAAIRRAINRHALVPLFLACLVLSAAPRGHADSEAPETYKWRLDAFWWFSRPTGHFSDTQNAPPSHSFDIQKDFGFGSYSTFAGNFDWRFTRRNHLLFGASPVQSSNTRSLSRTITFRGKTYDIGAAVSVDIQSLSFSPGYQFDFMRRRWGNLSGVAQLYVLNTSAKMSQSRTVNGHREVIEESSGSVLAPLPAIGPRVRWYPINDSSRFVVDGTATGMYLFGYGDFYSAKGTVGVAVSRHWKLTAGYQMGTRLTIHGTDDSMGFRLTQKGPMAGFEGAW